VPHRFADWRPGLARIVLAVLALLLVASAVVPVGRPDSSPESAKARAERMAAALGGDMPDKPYDQDIALYEKAIDRIRGGENYYDFIVADQRAADYPVNPPFAVRLPTLVYIDAWLGDFGQIVAAIALMLAIIAAWWRKLGEDPQMARVRRIGTTMVFVGASLGLNRYYFTLHELWAGGLIALSFGLHRIGVNGQGGRWGWALLAGALALAIREHALPFVLLMAATALYYRNWREAAAWSVLVPLFAIGLAWHLSLIQRDVLPSDAHSAPWLVMRGLSGWLGNIVQSSNLRFLPHWLSGPAVVLMTFGWLGWNSRAGTFGFLLAAGYGFVFLFASRWDNFYWGAMVAPAMFAGIVFAPRALASLIEAAKTGERPELVAVK
jgi:hypothetical protein